MIVTQLSDCDGNNMACATFMSGKFDPAPGCASEAGDNAASSVSADGGKDYANMGPPSSSDDASCSLAPGAIGAAHQAAYSSGYSATCPGTPAEGSPYMGPLAWSEDLDSRSMAYGSDDVVMTSQSRVFYRLDKNWKRSDTTLAQGVRRTVGQGPCAPEQIDQEFSQNGLIACIMDDDVSTGSPLTTIERSSPTTTTATTPSSSSSDTSVTLSFKQEFTNGPPDVMNLMYTIGMTAEPGFHVSRSCFDIVDFPVCSSSSSASSSSDEVPPPRTNESIEAWKEENASQSSSLGQFGSSTSAAVAVMVTILLSAFIF